MFFNNIYHKESESPANLRSFVIPAKSGERMYACLFKPEDTGPRPTILLLHGYPGDENNYDLAHAFQRAGYTVVVFHYRGTWGSEGLFSLNHVLEDVKSAIDFIRQHSGEEIYQFDEDQLILIGHSMGGFAALQTAASENHILGVAAVAAFDFSLAVKNPNLRAAMQKEFEYCLPVKRIGLDELMQEINDNAAAWSFPALAEKLNSHPICLIGAEKDDVSLPKYHFAPLADAIRQIKKSNAIIKMLKDGHCLSSTRLELTDILLEWIQTILKQEVRGHN